MHLITLLLVIIKIALVPVTEQIKTMYNAPGKSDYQCCPFNVYLLQLKYCNGHDVVKVL